MKDISLNKKTQKTLGSMPNPQKGLKSINSKSQKTKKNLTKWKLLVYMSKPQKHFSDLKATKTGFKKYHKIEKQDTKNLTK